MDGAGGNFTDNADRALQAKWLAEALERRHVYRYVSISDERFGRFYDVALRSLLYFSPFSTFNDPFDGQVRPNTEATPEERREFWTAQLASEGPIDPNELAIMCSLDPQAERKAVREVYDEKVAGWGVACFSATNDDLPMWGYYADSHKGLCLRFNVEHLLALASEGCSQLFPIDYVDPLSFTPAPFFTSTGFRRTRTAVGTKANVWSHEKEWRITRQGHGAVRIHPAALDGVILGCWTPDKDIERVGDVLGRRPNKVDLYRAHPIEDKFKLEIRPA